MWTYRAVAALRQEEAASYCSRPATLQSTIYRWFCIAIDMLVQVSKKQPDWWLDSLNEMFLNSLYQQTPLPLSDLWGVFCVGFFVCLTDPFLFLPRVVDTPITKPTRKKLIRCRLLSADPNTILRALIWILVFSQLNESIKNHYTLLCYMQLFHFRSSVSDAYQISLFPFSLTCEGTKLVRKHRDLCLKIRIWESSTLLWNRRKCFSKATKKKKQGFSVPFLYLQCTAYSIKPRMNEIYQQLHSFNHYQQLHCLLKSSYVY